MAGSPFQVTLQTVIINFDGPERHRALDRVLGGNQFRWTLKTGERLDADALAGAHAAVPPAAPPSEGIKRAYLGQCLLGRHVVIRSAVRSGRAVIHQQVINF